MYKDAYWLISINQNTFKNNYIIMELEKRDLFG